jgi:hypothetical protein
MCSPKKKANTEGVLERVPRRVFGTKREEVTRVWKIKI